MSTTQRPWPRPSWAIRVVPLVLVVALVVGVAVAGTARGRDEAVADLRGPTRDQVAAYVDDPALPVTYDQAAKAGTLDAYDWGPSCDTTRRYNDTDQQLARVAIPSTYAPPCVPVWGGTKPWVSQGGRTFADNGGATAPGVTADTITVAFYLPAEQDIAKQLEQFGVNDGSEATLDGIRQLVEMSNHLYETYGRKVRVVPFQASGDGRSPSAARADALRVVELGAFASLGGPSQTSAYELELARNHVLCIQCGYAATDDVLGEAAPYAWGYQATPDQLLTGIIGLGASMLGTHPAQYAGDPTFRSRPRKMGVVHYEQDPPIFGPLKDRSLAAYEAGGLPQPTVIQYILDPNTLNEQAQAIVGRLKREEITSVVFLGDPLMPRLLLQQATKQDYRPEWIFTGTALTDTTAVARLYDQEQMAHAFTASSNPSRTAPDASELWQLYRWWYGTDPDHPKTLQAWGPVVQLLYLGIHLAGPDLTAQTFAGGLFRYPPTGGTAVVGKTPVELFVGKYLEGDTTPAISFGPKGPERAVDYVAVDDFTIAWWDPTTRGPDENGTVGPGLWQYSGTGLRLPLETPTFPGEFSEDFLFKTKLSDAGGPLLELIRKLGIDDLTIAEPILQKVPALDVLPTYPVRPDAPAAHP